MHTLSRSSCSNLTLRLANTQSVLLHFSSSAPCMSVLLTVGSAISENFLFNDLSKILFGSGGFGIAGFFSVLLKNLSSV